MRCETDPCAIAAVREDPLGATFVARLPAFLANEWQERASSTRGAIDRARAAIGPELEPLVLRLASDLALEWPPSPAPVEVVADAPSPSRRAILPIALAANGSCFVAFHEEGMAVRNARILDCVLVYATLPLAARSRIYAEIERSVGAERATRAWTVLVVHAVAALVTGFEPRHSSVLRQSANVVAPKTLSWLAAHWAAHANRTRRREGAEAFAADYVEALESSL
jgi:hypothetical protein